MPEHALGSAQRPLRVAIVGSGPSAFYAAEALFKADALEVRVDMFDRLPTPFGLVRGGVAPDHQNIKGVVKVYDKIAADPRFRFFGNVTIGRDLRVDDLRSRYDQIVFAVGNESDRKMEIPGEDLAGVFAATEFVGWYNGHPDFRHFEFPLGRAERVVVVGNGNVAIDVARLLVRDPNELASTDIAEHALAALRASRVREVVLLGRRGPAQAAFAPKEIKELAELAGVDLVVDPRDVALDELSQRWLESAPRSSQRNVEILRELSGHELAADSRKVVCRFLRAPVELVADAVGHIAGVRVERAELVADDTGVPRPRGTGEFETLEAQIVFKAVGYHGVPLPGVSFDERRGVIPNRDGRVLDGVDGEVVPREYVVGWAKRGPSGLIGTNSPDSKATVAAMIADLSGTSEVALHPDWELEVPDLLASREIDFVSFEDWQRLDAYERAQGERFGKVRQKLGSIAEMMQVVQQLRASVS